jgi:N-acetylmuramoyl-L-alanine amidase
MPDTEYVVRQGDCFTSIADRFGFYWKTLWAHNSDLQNLRKNPNVLFQGDVVLIPEKEPKVQPCATDKRHKFLKLGTPAKLRIIVERFGQPIANTRYILTIDGKISEGVTGGDGLLEESIAPQARQGTLEIPDENLHCTLNLGYLDPIDEIVGVQRRLDNLGFYAGPLDGQLNDETRDAIAMFQAEAGITGTGDLDDATRQKLIARHDNEHAAPPVDADSAGAGPSGKTDEETPADAVGDLPETEEDRFENMD